MTQETLDRRLSAVERRTGRLETKVRDLDTDYGKAIYGTDRRVRSLEITVGRMAHAMGVLAATEDEIDATYEEEIDAALLRRRKEAAARKAAGEPPRRLSDMARRRAHVA